MSGISFERVGKYVRSVYKQDDGRTILADECRCIVDFGGGYSVDNRRSLSVKRTAECPIDEHKAQANS
jgi:hypothetical protein